MHSGRITDGQLVSHRQPKLVTGGALRDYQLDGLDWLRVSEYNICTCVNQTRENFKSVYVPLLTLALISILKIIDYAFTSKYAWFQVSAVVTSQSVNAFYAHNNNQYKQKLII